jgi:membrane fusion protein (multidrug efflux system)
MKPFIRRSLLGLLAIVVLGAGGWVLKHRSAAAPTAADAAASHAAPAASGAADAGRLTLGEGDVQTVRQAPLTQEVSVSGSLRARQSAVLKAKVAGELQSLNVREGEAVRAGQTLGQIDTTELLLRVRQAEQQAQAAQAQRAVAERTLSNNEAMVSQGFISPTALETSRLNAEGARATWQAAQAGLELARKAQADARLVAPISGLVAQRLAQPGERLAVDAKVLEIVDLSQIELEAALAPQDVVQVRIGASASVRVDGLNEALPAKVARINPSANSASRTVSVYLTLPAHPALRQGLFAQGQISLGQRSALLVPSDALRLDQPQPALLVLAGGKVLRRSVRVGAVGMLEGQAMTEVLQGVHAGEQVLAARVGLVADGTLAVLPAAAAAATSAPSAASAASR